MHRRVQHIQVNRRQARLDRLELLLARFTDSRRGLRRDRHDRFASAADTHKNVSRLTLAVAEWYVAAPVNKPHQSLAVLAQRPAGVAFKMDLHDLDTH